VQQVHGSRFLFECCIMHAQKTTENGMMGVLFSTAVPSLVSSCTYQARDSALISIRQYKVEILKSIPVDGQDRFSFLSF